CFLSRLPCILIVPEGGLEDPDSPERGIAHRCPCLPNRGELTMMSSASGLRRFRHDFPKKSHKRRLFLETLEDRSVPSIIFNNASTTSVTDGGGLVLDQVHVELIF